MSNEGFTFQGTGKLARIDRFATKNGKTILTLIFEIGGQWPRTVPIKVFGRLAECASEWNPGDILEVTGTLGGRDWNGKVYGDISARTVEVVSQTKLPHGKPADEPPSEPVGATPAREAEDPGSVPF